MAGIFGSIQLTDTDRVFQATVGQQIIWDEVEKYVTRVNDDLNAALAVFLEGDTEKFKLRYKLPGGGSLQRRAENGSYGSVKPIGQWDIGLPLEDFGAQISGNDVAMAYMTVEDLDRYVTTVGLQAASTLRFELLKSLFNNTERTFQDPINGALLVEPVANGDSVLFPPLLGSETEATENHFLASGYAPTAIDATHNPIPTIVNELEEHFGTPMGGSNIAVFVPTANLAKIEALPDFDDDGISMFIIPGLTMNVLTGLPMNVPGRLVGRCDGAWIVEWRSLPSNYLIGIHLGAPKPIMRRNDPADTGLPRGLNLVKVNERFPFEGSFFRDRFGLGVGNRLNGVVMFLDAGASYVIPTAYA